MLLPAVLAALAVVPAIVAQDGTSYVTRCSTQYGLAPLATGEVVTWYNHTTTTNVFDVTYTTRPIVVVTPTASSVTNVITTTETVETTTTTTPSPVTIATPAGFLPLLVAALPGPTGVSRVKRYELDSRDADPALLIFRRQTAANHTAGFFVDRNGKTSDLELKYPLRVDCRISVTVNRTVTTTVTGVPETSFAAASTAVILSTSTVSSTTTVTAIAPRKTVYAACQANNIVNSIVGFTGEELIFDRLLFRPNEGFPIKNELIVNTTSAENCCIACQNTKFCAGSFFVPSQQECHLRLTQSPNLTAALPAPVNSTFGSYPTMYNSAVVVPSRTSGAPVPTSTGGINTCAAGSLSLYLGMIEGQRDFPKEYALAFSNGPCGRMSVWPLPVTDDLNSGIPQQKAKRMAIA